jgi:hypothetical protein
MTHRNDPRRPGRALAVLVAVVLTTALATGCGSDAASSAATTAAPVTTTVAPAAASTVGPAATLPATTGLDDIRAKALEATLANISKNGLGADRACVTAIVAQLSDDDAVIIASAAPDATDVAVSPEGDALAAKLKDCLTSKVDAALVRQAVDRIVSSKDGALLDAACLTKNFSLLDEATLKLIITSPDGSNDPKLATASAMLLDCFGRAATTDSSGG